MGARLEDIKDMLRDYPAVSRSDRSELVNFYRRASFPDLIQVISDPSLEPKVRQLRQDHPEFADGRSTMALGLGAALLGATVLAVLAF